MARIESAESTKALGPAAHPKRVIAAGSTVLGALPGTMPARSMMNPAKIGPVFVHVGDVRDH